ncbi:hypothetical protein AKJ49_01895 [candidate division MSBL1 archaeon SCGC-AAA382A03]|uniref:PIN domain-containing protein n=1 Tax=candidate division MSBL1 archaeon SCGC-AAA382A03 TaxID=1698278 RepID=A0A133VDU8_9EURY|nr:hypothetical protein AKJ49_01895 [candidate division MSBL1 archaeon SCGC-AAA382A03]
MIVADTSALISLAFGTALNLFLNEFEVAITETVVDELEELSRGEDSVAKISKQVLLAKDSIKVYRVKKGELVSSRVDKGEGSCVLLARKLEADFLITDDLRALPELEKMIGGSEVAISPIVLRALINRGVLNRKQALEKLEQMSKKRDWLHRPIYKKARNLLKE